MKLLIVISFLLSRLVFGHGDHSVPGSIPPGLHGGFVKEADHAEEEHGHEHGHSHDEEEPHEHHDGDNSHDDEHGHKRAESGKESKPESKEQNLFFEAVYNAQGKKLSLYPLVLETPASVLFTSLPVASVSISSLKIEFPRTKKVAPVEFKATESAIEAAVQPGNAVRFIVHVEAKHNGETKVAKIQVETER